VLNNDPVKIEIKHPQHISVLISHHF